MIGKSSVLTMGMMTALTKGKTKKPKMIARSVNYLFFSSKQRGTYASRRRQKKIDDRLVRAAGYNLCRVSSVGDAFGVNKTEHVIDGLRTLETVGLAILDEKEKPSSGSLICSTRCSSPSTRVTVAVPCSATPR